MNACNIAIRAHWNACELHDLASNLLADVQELQQLLTENGQFPKVLTRLQTTVAAIDLATKGLDEIGSLLDQASRMPIETTRCGHCGSTRSASEPDLACPHCGHLDSETSQSPSRPFDATPGSSWPHASST